MITSYSESISLLAFLWIFMNFVDEHFLNRISSYCSFLTAWHWQCDITRQWQWQRSSTNKHADSYMRQHCTPHWILKSQPTKWWLAIKSFNNTYLSLLGMKSDMTTHGARDKACQLVDRNKLMLKSCIAAAMALMFFWCVQWDRCSATDSMTCHMLSGVGVASNIRDLGSNLGWTFYLYFQ